MTKKENKIEYKKPELISIDDPAFDEKGLGDSGWMSVYCSSRNACSIKSGCHSVTHTVCGTVGKSPVCGSVTICTSVD